VLDLEGRRDVGVEDHLGAGARLRLEVTEPVGHLLADEHPPELHLVRRPAEALLGVALQAGDGNGCGSWGGPVVDPRHRVEGEVVHHRHRPGHDRSIPDSRRADSSTSASCSASSSGGAGRTGANPSDP
jgi:hypothetical protein